MFVACNAWTSTQATWLDAQLAKQTTYTFVVRHESTSAVSQTPCNASQAIINAHPLRNTMTTTIASADLLKFLEATGHKPRILELVPPYERDRS